MRRSGAGGLAAVLVAALLSGCGGGNEAATAPATTGQTTTRARAADPGRDVIDAFVAAARRSDTAGMWRLLSTSSRKRLGPTLAAFRKQAATELIEGVGSFRSFEVVVSERITPEFGVVAIDGSRRVEGSRERGVYAVALRIEGSAWKLELAGPVTIRPIGPDPGARERIVAQVAAAVEGPGGTGTAVLYVDGQAVLDPKVVGTSASSTIYANLEPALEPGRHTVLVFATAGREASATAWSFTAEKR